MSRSSSQQCAGKLQNVPVCKDPTVTDGFLGGTAVAMPYSGLDGKLASLSSALAAITGMPRSGDEPASSSKAANSAASKETNAASPVGMDGYGKMVGMVAGVWGLAAIGGAGFIFF